MPAAASRRPSAGRVPVGGGVDAERGVLKEGNGAARPRGPALVEAVGVSRGDYAVDAEVLRELLHVYGGRREREKGVAVIGAILTLFPEPLPIGGMDLRLASQLFAAQPRLWARYALDAAVRCAMVPRPS